MQGVEHLPAAQPDRRERPAGGAHEQHPEEGPGPAEELRTQPAGHGLFGANRLAKKLNKRGITADTARRFADESASLSTTAKSASMGVGSGHWLKYVTVVATTSWSSSSRPSRMVGSALE